MSAPLQMTYTSYDRLDGGRGGWQVKDRTPELPDPDLQHALGLVATELDLVVPPPPFPSTDEIARLPRRLVLEVDAQGTAFVVHTTYAGADASGRHGNVFNHVLVVPRVEEQVRLGEPRPLVWWRSASWLTPYGADAVRDAALPIGPWEPGPVVSRDTVAQFLAGGRGAAIGSLLDAVQSALDGGPRVVLALDDQDEAALWLGAVSFLAPAALGAQLSFSTYERAHSLQSPGGSPLVSVVPADDAPALATLSTHRLAELHGGSPAGTWALLAAAVADNPQHVVAERLLALDELTALNPRAARLVPLWPLALAVAESDDTSAAWSAALRVLLQVPLPEVEDDETRHLVETLVAEAVGTSSASARALLEVALADGQGLRDHLVEVYRRYVELTAADDAVLAQPEPAWVVPLDPVAHAQVLHSLAQTLATSFAGVDARTADPQARAVLTARLLELAQRVGVTPLLADDAAVRAALARAGEVLAAPGGAVVARAAGSLSDSTVAALATGVAEVIAAQEACPGERIDPAVAIWLSERLGAAADQLPSPLDEELLVHAAATPAGAGRRAEAALVLMRSPQWLPAAAPDERAESAVRRVAGTALWLPEDLLHLLDGIAGDLSLDLDRPSRDLLLRGPLGDPVLAGVGQALLDDDDPQRPLPPQLRRLATVHALCAPQWWRAGPDTWPESAELLASGMPLFLDVDVPQSLSDALRPQLLAAAVRTVVWSAYRAYAPGDPTLLRRLREVAGDVADLNDRLTESLEPLVPMLAADLDLTGQLLRLAAQQRFGEFGTPTRPVPPDLLVEPLQPADAAALGGGTLAEVALARVLAQHPDPSGWLAQQVETIPYIRPDLEPDLHRWTQGLLPGSAPALLPDDEPRSSPWRR